MDRLVLVHMDLLSCEPILRRMPNGELLIIAQCGDVKEPAPGNRVYSFRSMDNGNTWSRKQSIYPEDGNAVYATEVMVLGEEITAFLSTHNGNFVNWNCVCIKSHNNGYLWETLKKNLCFEHYTFIRGMIQLSSGEILLPYQHYPITREENDRLFKAGLPWSRAEIDYVENGVVSSTDGGKTFVAYPGVQLPFGGNTGRRWIWSEPTIVELSDSSIGMLLRMSNTGCLWYAKSLDKGRTWTDPMPTDIPNPSNKPKLIALPNGGIALLHTPNPKEGMQNRNPLSIWISRDDMQSWPYQHVVTQFPGAFCYPDGFYEDGHILFSIEYNRHDILFIDHALPQEFYK